MKVGDFYFYGQNGGECLLDSRDKDGKTPLHYAAAKGNIEVRNEP